PTWSSRRPSPTSTPSARWCSRRSRWSRTPRRTSCTTCSRRRCSRAIRSTGKRSISAYHRRAYVAGNVVLAAAGNLEHDQLLGLLERAARQRVEPPDRRTRVRSPLVRVPAPGMRFQQKDTEQFHVCVGAPGIARSDRRRFAASLLDAILGGSASSRLFQEIREKRGMAYTVYSFGSQYTDSGLVGIYVGTREENL